jgi:hypothetical protein
MEGARRLLKAPALTYVASSGDNSSAVQGDISFLERGKKGEKDEVFRLNTPHSCYEDWLSTSAPFPPGYPNRIISSIQMILGP